jgi:hypothetical protein
MIDNQCFEKVGFFLSASGLKKLDTFSNTDPFCVVSTRDPKTELMMVLGITEVIMDSQAPEWPTLFVVNYYFEAVQEITVRMYDRDGNYPLNQTNYHDFCGEVKFHLSSLMCSKGQQLSLNLANGKSGGVCTIRAEPIANTNDIFTANFVASKLANKDGIFGRSDPFLRFYRLQENGQSSLCFQSKEVMNNLSPNFGNIRIPMVTLCNGDEYRPIRIDVMDFDKDGTHDPMVF